MPRLKSDLTGVAGLQISKKESYASAFSRFMSMFDGMHKFRSLSLSIGGPHSYSRNYDSSSNPQTDMWAFLIG